MKLNIQSALNTRNLHWDRSALTFSEEASTCRFFNSYRLYDDACDEGVWVQSHVTGELKPFNLVNVQRDNDGDVTKWDFEFARFRQPTIRLVIFND